MSAIPSANTCVRAVVSRTEQAKNAGDARDEGVRKIRPRAVVPYFTNTSGRLVFTCPHLGPFPCEVSVLIMHHLLTHSSQFSKMHLLKLALACTCSFPQHRLSDVRFFGFG